MKKINKIIASSTLCLLVASASMSTHASTGGIGGFARNQATAFIMLYVDKANSPLSQISTLTRLFYQQYGACPSSNRFKLKLPADSVFSEVTNNNCVVIATYKTIGVPTPLRGIKIGAGPRYIHSTETWSFQDMIFATNLLSLAGNEFQPIPGSPSSILSLSSNFIGGVYAASPNAYLSSTANRQPPKV